MKKYNNWNLTDVLVAGRLASKDDIGFKRPHHNAELFNGKAYFKIKPMSSKFLYPKKDLYNYNQKIKIYVGTLLHDLPDINFKDDNTDDNADRKDKLYEFFKNYLFVVQPSYNVTKPLADSNKININIDGFTHGIHLIHKIGEDFPYDELSPVPIFNVSNTFHWIKNRKDFQHALAQTQPLGYIREPWPVSSNAYPDGVIWEDKDGHCALYTNIIKQGVQLYYANESLDTPTIYYKKVAYGFENEKPKLNSKVFYDEKWLNKQYIYGDVAFINQSLLSKPNRKINDIRLYRFTNIRNSAQQLKNSNMSEFHSSNKVIDASSSDSSVTSKSDDDSFETSAADDSTGVSSSDIASKSSNDVNNAGDDLASSSAVDSSEASEANSNDSSSDYESKGNPKIIKGPDETNMSQENSRPVTETDNNSKNVAFIHKLMKNAIDQDDNPEFFKEEDLINFHTAMLSPGLVVLAGLSGTGKSSLINLYAETLGIPESQRKFIPVRPFWNDDSDLLGYVDTVHSIYQPADCGLVDTLVKAQENPNKLYLITFDEMNLARVEYYFSQFLSVLERDSNKRYIYLYDKNLTSRLYNSHDYPYRIKIGKNVLFCGTINMDESTHKFTDKVLDRSNIINLQLVNFNSDKTVIDHTNRVATDVDTLPDVIDTKYFDEMKRSRQLDNDTKRDIKRLLWSLHQLLHHANSNLGVGRRIVRQIFMYLENVPKMPDGDNYHLSMKTAFDLQLAQRVFTKLRGSQQDIGKLITLDDNGHVTDDEGTLWAKLSDTTPLSDFKYSKRVLERKGGELENYGFTL